MIQMYKFGTAIKTDAVVAKLENSAKKNVLPKHGSTHITKEKNTFEWTYTLKDTDIVYGLGEANRGINKRGWIYKSWCTDDFYHTEEKESLYGAHNFIIVYTPPCSQNNCCETAFGLFFDFPGKITFDIGYTKQNTLHITVTDLNLDVYEITADKPLNDTSSSALIDIVTQFRQLIGQSYIPPRWAFGLGQSRWGYKTEADIRRVYEGYKNADIPLDAIYLDIDYMVDYKDFTIDTTKFPHFKELVSELKKDGVRLVPIIDAGVKIEKGYDVYEEGKERGFFCKRKDGTDFAAGVWPGRTHFPDFLNPKARQWFGEK